MSTLLKYVFVLMVLCLQTTFAQKKLVETGTVLEIIKPEGPFRHVNLPHNNFIIKRGAIANLNSLSGKLVVVTAVKEVGGIKEVILKRKDGRKFFRNYATITANWPDAIEAGELRRVD
jgi:hypothetical protein